MALSDEKERQLYHFLEDLGRELPVQGSIGDSHELRVFSALVHALQKDLSSLLMISEPVGVTNMKRSGDDDESEWWKVARSDIKNKNTFVRSIAWLDLFFSEHLQPFPFQRRISPLYQLSARVSIAIGELQISEELWERIRKVKEDFSTDVGRPVWKVLLEKYDEGNY